MIGSKFIFNGNLIPYTTLEGQTSGWYVSVIWKQVSHENSAQNRQDFHGVESNPTFARGRLITLDGELFDLIKVNRGTIRNSIDTIFKLQDFPGATSAFKVLSFTDDDGIIKFIYAKVRQSPIYDQRERAAVIIPFTVELFAEDPLIRWPLAANSVVCNYGLFGGTTLPLTAPFDLDEFIPIKEDVFGGMTLPLTAPVALDQTISADSITNAGNFSSPATITITGEIINPMILNLTTGKFFKHILTLSGSDSLVIDTNNATSELNGANALGFRDAGSNWIFIDPGLNNLVLLGDDFDWDNQDKAQMTVEWFNTSM